MKYDVVIAGGGTAGVSCAYNCAIRGLKTLLIEINSFFGGSMTASLVTPAMKTSENSINNDFFNLLSQNLHDINGQITYIDGNRGWFNPEMVKIVLDNMLVKAGVDTLFESYISNISTKENKITSVNIESLCNDNNLKNRCELSSHIDTKYLVDGTGDAKIFQKLNLKFLENYENNFQPVNLRFILSGVDVKKFSEWIINFDKNRDITTACDIDGNTYLSTAYTWDAVDWALKPLFERGIADGVITDADSNYFQLFSVAGTNGSVAFNAPRLLDSAMTRSDAYIKGRESIYRLYQFCKRYLSGFENSYISSIANTLGVRVSNRIKGKYIYTYDDLISGKTFKNPVLRSNYPVDIHSNKKGSSLLKKVFQDYELPLESLISADYDNLYAIGRCISADFKAQAALRIIPSCFSMGEGLAKYLAKNV